jgi:hypothetical protein
MVKPENINHGMIMQIATPQASVCSGDQLSKDNVTNVSNATMQRNLGCAALTAQTARFLKVQAADTTAVAAITPNIINPRILRAPK